MFCEKCGNRVKETDKFCSVCGNALDSSEHNYETSQSNNNSDFTVSAIGYVLMLIGGLTGFVSIAYIISCEAAHTDTTTAGWNYHYNGGQQTAIIIALFAVTAFFVGLCMSASKKK